MGHFINGFIIFSIVTSFCFIYGIFMFISDYETNRCNMTYMFEYPQFVRISMDVDKNYKKYGLYAYSEGHFTEKARNMHFDGIPVLFIPGNGGSHKQVRSLASVALRKSVNSRTRYYFDYFTIDTNGEFSGINGVLLEDQTIYANHSLHRILELYSKNPGVKPQSVIVVGHSMGGIVAKALLSSLPMESKLIPLIITLATPHRRLPIFFDYYAYYFYKNIEKYQDNSETTVINIFGGYNDFMVTPNIVNTNGINAVTTNVPKAWIPTDHLCILWCKQLVLGVNRALFDSIDLKTKQISNDTDYVESVFKHHLVKNSGIKPHLQHRYETATSIDENGEWIEYLQRQYSLYFHEGLNHMKWYMIRLVKHAKHEMLTILAVNLEVTDWVYVCPAAVIKGHSRVCIQGMHLSHLSEIAPTKRYKRRLLNINLHELQYKYPTYTHVIAKILPTSEPVTLHVDVYEKNQRRVDLNLPHRLSLYKETVVNETIEKALYYELTLPKLTHIIQVYGLYLEPTTCSMETYHVTASLSVPWVDDQYHHHFTEVDKDPMNLRLYTSRPMHENNLTASVKLILDPGCRYKISIKSSIPSTLAQLVRFYTPLLFSYIVTVTLLTFVFQLRALGLQQRCPLFISSLIVAAKPYYFLPAIKILSLTLSIPVLRKYLPLPDWYTIHEEGLDFFFLPIILFFISVGLVWILSVTLMVSLFLFESTIHKISLKFVSKIIRTPTVWSDWILRGFHTFPALVSICLTVMTSTTCGGLALCLGCIFYFLKLTQMSQDVTENIVKKLVKILTSRFKHKVLKKQQCDEAETKEEKEVECERPQREIDNGQEDIANDGEEKIDDSSEKDIKRTEKIAEVSRKENKTTTNDIQNKKDASSDKSIEQDYNVPGKSNDESFTKEQIKPVNIQANSKNDSEKDLFSILREEIMENNELFFHFTIFCLWFLVTCINIPAVLTWAHNFKFNPKLVTDPSFIPGILLCICSLPLWQSEFPKIEKKGYVELSYLIYVLGIIGIVYGTFSPFVINYVLSGVIVIVVLHQLLAPKRIIENSRTPEEGEVSFKDVKSKLE